MNLHKTILQVTLFTILLVGFSSCSDSDDKKNDPVPASCIDGIMNQNETGIDCGGVCPACQTCSDGIKNQNETGIDCGGVCPPCNFGTPTFTATIDGSSWTANSSINVTNSPATKITFIGISNDGSRLSVIYSGPFTLGTVNIGPGFSMEYRNAGGTVFGGISGSITFSQFNTSNEVITGYFLGQVKDNLNNVTKTISMSNFQNIAY